MLTCLFPTPTALNNQNKIIPDTAFSESNHVFKLIKMDVCSICGTGTDLKIPFRWTTDNFIPTPVQQGWLCEHLCGTKTVIFKGKTPNVLKRLVLRRRKKKKDGRKLCIERHRRIHANTPGGSETKRREGWSENSQHIAHVPHAQATKSTLLFGGLCTWQMDRVWQSCRCSREEAFTQERGTRLRERAERTLVCGKGSCESQSCPTHPALPAERKCL